VALGRAQTRLAKDERRFVRFHLLDVSALGVTWRHPFRLGTLVSQQSNDFAGNLKRKSPISETNATSFLQGFGPARIRRILFLFFWKRGTLQRDAEIESF
jgi:hypothetical protein